MFSGRGTTSSIGLDLGHDSIKLAQLIHTADQPRLLASAREPFPEQSKLGPDERLKTSLEIARRLMDQKPFRGRQVAACLPRELVQLKNIRLPVMPLDEVESAVAFESATAFGLDPSAAMFRHIVAGEVRQGNESRLEVICLAARSDEVDAYVESFHRAGLSLCSLEFEPVALFRGVQRFVPAASASEVNVLLDIGYRRTQVIIGHGSSVQFFKPIDIGSRRLTATVARKLEISEKEVAVLRSQLNDVNVGAAVDDSIRLAVEDATRQTFSELIREVALCLRYFSVTFRGVRIRKIRVAGGEENCALLRSMICSDLSIPLEGSPIIESLKAEASTPVTPWCLPIGLALGSVVTPKRPRARDASRESWNVSSTPEVEVLDA